MVNLSKAQGLISFLKEHGFVTIDESALLEEVVEAARTAYQDPVTRLGNRRKFEDDLAARTEEAIRTCQDFCIIYADLDRFKQANDTLGHIIGDKILQAVGYLTRVAGRRYNESDTLIISVKRRGYDLAYRLGGDEYAFILPGANLKAGMAVAERYRHQIEGNPMVHGVSITLGVASFRTTLADIGAADSINLQRQRDELINTLRNYADKALYAAKEAGRNRVYGFLSSNPTFSFCTINNNLQKE